MIHGTELSNLKRAKISTYITSRSQCFILAIFFQVSVFMHLFYVQALHARNDLSQYYFQRLIKKSRNDLD